MPNTTDSNVPESKKETTRSLISISAAKVTTKNPESSENILEDFLIAKTKPKNTIVAMTRLSVSGPSVKTNVSSPTKSKKMLTRSKASVSGAPANLSTNLDANNDDPPKKRQKSSNVSVFAGKRANTSKAPSLITKAPFLITTPKPSNPFSCQLCLTTFSFVGNLKRHVKYVHLKTELKCDYCPAKFETRNLYQKHRAVCDDRKTWKKMEDQKTGAKKKYLRTNKTIKEEIIPMIKEESEPEKEEDFNEQLAIDGILMENLIKDNTIVMDDIQIITEVGEVSNPDATKVKVEPSELDKDEPTIQIKIKEDPKEIQDTTKEEPKIKKQSDLKNVNKQLKSNNPIQENQSVIDKSKEDTNIKIEDLIKIEMDQDKESIDHVITTNITPCCNSQDLLQSMANHIEDCKKKIAKDEEKLEAVENERDDLTTEIINLKAALDVAESTPMHSAAIQNNLPAYYTTDEAQNILISTLQIEKNQKDAKINLLKGNVNRLTNENEALLNENQQIRIDLKDADRSNARTCETCPELEDHKEIALKRETMTQRRLKRHRDRECICTKLGAEYYNDNLDFKVHFANIPTLRSVGITSQKAKEAVEGMMAKTSCGKCQNSLNILLNVYHHDKQ